jgi:superfamily II DNA helicase RecQ
MDPAAALREHFGFDACRSGQVEAVRAAVGPPARDVLVVMPTGAGTSLCYEAHCVSQWGHDVRPDYFRLVDAARWLAAEAIVASTATATATRQVARDIEARLGLCDPVRVTTGFDRPNLSFAVIRCATTVGKHRHIAAALGAPGATPAIVYAGTRAGTEKLDAAIRSVVASATPRVGRTRTVEILRGGRAKGLLARGYDGLPEYGTFDHLGAREVLARVDELIGSGRLRITVGAFSTLEAAAAACAA